MEMSRTLTTAVVEVVVSYSSRSSGINLKRKVMSSRGLQVIGGVKFGVDVSSSARPEESASSVCSRTTV